MSDNKNNSVAFGQSIKHYLASLIAQKDYAKAIKYYKDNLIELESFGNIQAGEIYHLAARAYASLTHYHQALKTARMAQNKIAASGDNHLLAEIFLTIGGILRDMGEAKEAKNAFRDAESIFRRNDCQEGRSRALNYLAGLFFRQNDFSNSLHALMDAIDIARRQKDNKKLAYMMGNIGRIYTFIGDFNEAIKHLNINIELSQNLNDTTEIARAYLSLGYVHMQKGNYPQAKESLEKAQPLIIQNQLKRDEVIYLTYLGELFYLSGQLEESQEVLEKALHLANKIDPDITLTGRVLRHLAELNLRRENYRMAHRFCFMSWVIMEKANNKMELGALLRVKAVLAEKAVENEESIKDYKQAIAVLDESGVRFERAQALVAAGQSKLFTVRQRLNYLFRAAEFYQHHNLLFQQEKVERIIDEIDSLSVFSPKNAMKKNNRFTEDVDFITACPEIRHFKKQLPLLTNTDLPLLLTGETGVGKDHMARYFHAISRPHMPFVAINCSSLPETLLESELFGYKKGAFTGAENNKQGLFVVANSGILFLDEIGDMPLTLQTKLLGVLENRKVIPLGSTTSVKLDIKLVAATNKNLEQMVEEGTFRRDLYYRLSGLHFNIPPLRERKEDIPLLLKLFMKRCHLLNSKQPIPSELIQQFVFYDWPGNTRELFNKVKRLEVMTQMVAEGDLIEISRTIFNQNAEVQNNTLFERVEQFERKIILEALLATHGNKSEAARMLGIHEATVRSKLKRYHITLADLN
ncbi:MAG: tetratricopeptide repeat protein [FCB group bacterium]|nr:tetratricopeptide repeat protein [FCB group bacterium]